MNPQQTSATQTARYSYLTRDIASEITKDSLPKIEVPRYLPTSISEKSSTFGTNNKQHKTQQNQWNIRGSIQRAAPRRGTDLWKSSSALTVETNDERHKGRIRTNVHNMKPDRQSY